MKLSMHDADLYEYAVLRYVPRVEREEFLNIGLVMMCKRRRWMRARVSIDRVRLEAMRAPHTSDEIENQSRTFTSLAHGGRDAGFLGEHPVEERFRWLTAVKSSSLQTSRPHPGLTCDLDAEFERLFSELVL